MAIVETVKYETIDLSTDYSSVRYLDLVLCPYILSICMLIQIKTIYLYLAYIKDMFSSFESI